MRATEPSVCGFSIERIPQQKKAIKAALDGAPVYRNVNMKEEQALNRLRKDENLTYILAKPVNQGTVFGDVAHEQATGATVAIKAIKAAKSMKAPPPESSAEATLIGYKGQLNAGVGHFPTSADELRAEVFDKNLESASGDRSKPASRGQVKSGQSLQDDAL